MVNLIICLNATVLVCGGVLYALMNSQDAYKAVPFADTTRYLWEQFLTWSEPFLSAAHLPLVPLCANLVG